MHRIPLLAALLSLAVFALACSGGGGESTTSSKTPEQIAELEAECLKNAQEPNEPEDLAAISECLEQARK